MNIQKDSLWLKVIDQVRTWARLNSIWAIHFNSGSCNGCDIEILATLTPRYDVERFGIKLEPSPRAIATYLRADARAEVCRVGRIVQYLRRRLPGLLQRWRLDR